MAKTIAAQQPHDAILKALPLEYRKRWRLDFHSHARTPTTPFAKIHPKDHVAQTKTAIVEGHPITEFPNTLQGIASEILNRILCLDSDLVAIGVHADFLDQDLYNIHTLDQRIKIVTQPEIQTGFLNRPQGIEILAILASKEPWPRQDMFCEELSEFGAQCLTHAAHTHTAIIGVLGKDRMFHAAVADDVLTITINHRNHCHRRPMRYDKHRLLAILVPTDTAKGPPVIALEQFAGRGFERSFGSVGNLRLHTLIKPNIFRKR